MKSTRLLTEHPGTGLPRASRIPLKIGVLAAATELARFGSCDAPQSGSRAITTREGSHERQQNFTEYCHDRIAFSTHRDPDFAQAPTRNRISSRPLSSRRLLRRCRSRCRRHRRRHHKRPHRLQWASHPGRPCTIRRARADGHADRAHPDPLLAQIFAAATYPDQLPDAARCADQHHYLSGQALADAIQADQLPWDPSVQALLPFPTVLSMMASDMPWTGALGNAFLAQQQDVMNAVQRDRGEASQYGYLAAIAK